MAPLIPHSVYDKLICLIIFHHQADSFPLWKDRNTREGAGGGGIANMVLPFVQILFLLAPHPCGVMRRAILGVQYLFYFSFCSLTTERRLSPALV